jgi:hypothetical protein
MIAVLAYSTPKSLRNVADMPHLCMKALKNPSTHYDICITIMVSIGCRIVYRIRPLRENAAPWTHVGMTPQTRIRENKGNSLAKIRKLRLTAS